jgi:hypothetical protein
LNRLIPKPFLWLLTLSAWLGLASCGVIEVAKQDAGGPCVENGGCRAGLQCYQQRICVAADVPPTPVVVRLTPPADSGLLVEQFDLVLDGKSQAQPFKLVLTEPAVVRGTVTQQGNPLAESIPGTLIATAPAAIDGRDLSYNATSFAVQKLFPGSDQPHGYELRVQPGFTYALAFWPESKDFPPFYPQPVTVNGTLADWKIELPGQAQLLHVAGQMLLSGQPLPGLRVALEDTQGRVRSTLAVTDAKGAFTLLVDPAAPAGVLHIEPATSKDPLPRGRLPVPANLAKEALKNAAIDLGAIDLGDSGQPVPVQVQVQGVNGGKIAGALVTVSHALAGPKPGKSAGLEISVTGHADNDGVFSTLMPPGALAVTVVPPPKSASAVQHWTGDFQGGQVTVHCQGRIVLQGEVRDFTEKLIDDADVTLRRVGSTSKSDASVAADDQLIAATTDGKGAFKALVDPGSYVVWVEPSKKSGLPRVLAAWVDVSAEQMPTPLQLRLPPPMVFAGSVLSAGGKTIAGVLVDVLTVKPVEPLSGAKPPPDQGTIAPGALLDSHLLATTVSGVHGAFEVLLAWGQVK